MLSGLWNALKGLELKMKTFSEFQMSPFKWGTLQARLLPGSPYRRKGKAVEATQKPDLRALE